MHDKNGDITKDGWSRKSSLEFFKKSKCFVRQYNKFKAGKQSVSKETNMRFFLAIRLLYMDLYILVALLFISCLYYYHKTFYLKFI